MAATAPVLFAIASGFTIAGLLSAVHGLIRDRAGMNRGAIGLSFANPVVGAWSLLLCAFAGPYLSLALALPSWRRGRLPGPVLAFLGLIAGVWSFCSGVFVVQAGLLVGLLSAG